LNQTAKPASRNVITVRSNGPLVCAGDFTVLAADGEVLAQGTDLYLCRCGGTKKPPFCDGSHKGIDFDDGNGINDPRDEHLEETSGPVTITCRPNAMYVVKGKVTIQTGDGSQRTTRSKAALCRCGASGNKPFCDTSHKTSGFEMD
jgi:CDGSH-type Zn-finger protein